MRKGRWVQKGSLLPLPSGPGLCALGAVSQGRVGTSPHSWTSLTPGLMLCLCALGLLRLPQVRQAAGGAAVHNRWCPSRCLLAPPSTLLPCTKPAYLSTGNGPCLGFRKLKQPYQWLSYQEVSDRGQAPLCLPLQAWHLGGLVGTLLGLRGSHWPCLAYLPHCWQQPHRAARYLGGELGRSPVGVPPGPPPLQKTPCFPITSPRTRAGGRQG